jgi:hypothetical protein
MKRRYILYRRKRGGMFYIEDTETRKQESTGTRNRAEATSLLNARNESIRQPHLNLQIAKAYLAGTDSGVATRTWQQALDAIIETKSGATQDRWRQAQQQGHSPRLRPRSASETAFVGELRAASGGGTDHSVAASFIRNANKWPQVSQRWLSRACLVLGLGAVVQAWLELCALIQTKTCKRLSREESHLPSKSLVSSISGCSKALA